MRQQFKSCRRAFTLIELLIVMGIIGLLIQLMLPAIQSSREAARRAQCSSNMRQLGLAVSHYESASKVLPPGFTNKPYAHNLIQYLLPYIEQSSIYDLYDFEEDWDADPNKHAAEQEVAVLRCPTAPADHPWATDYAIYRSMFPALYDQLVQEKLIRERTSTLGMLRKNEVRTALITDGLSHTVLLCESAGHPDRYELGQFVKANRGEGSRWADPGGRFDVRYRCSGAAMDQGAQLVNCKNDGEIYSFHPQGANFVLGDASVRYLLEDVEPDVLLSLLTAEGDD